MKTSLDDLLATLPKPATAARPDGVFTAEGLAHGTMTLEVFAPRAEDCGTAHAHAHAQDALYVVAAGHAELRRGSGDDGESERASAGEALFVRAGHEHRFAATSDDFVAWVVRWGPEGGEAPSPAPSVFSPVDA